MESLKYSLIKQKQLIEVEITERQIHCPDYYRKLNVVYKVISWLIKVVDSMITDTYKESHLEQ